MVNTNNVDENSQTNITGSDENESTLDIDSCLAKLNLVCLNGHNDISQISSNKSSCNSINSICKCGITCSTMKCKECKQIMCKLCVIATSIWTAIAKNT